MATIAWDVEQGGNDNNGGGFLLGGTGIDRSLQLAAQVVIDNVSITATISASTITFTAGYTPTTNDVGNVVNIISSTGGTPPTFSRYSISSITASTWVLDRTTGAVGATITSANMGGCFATIAAALAAMGTVSTSNTDDSVFVKYSATPYSISVGLVLSNSTGYSRLIGYHTTHEDNPSIANAPILQATAAITLITLNVNKYWQVCNFTLDGNTRTGTIGIDIFTANGLFLINVLIKNFSSIGYNLNSGAGKVYNSEIFGCGGRGAVLATNGGITNSYIHNNSGGGIGFNTNVREVTIVGCIVANNTGTGISTSSLGGNTALIYKNLLYGNTSDGLSLPSTSPGQFPIILNNIFAKNGGYGIGAAGVATWKNQPWCNYNGYWSNTSGTIVGINQGANDVVIPGTDPTNDPFVNKSSQDWRLNNTTGAGALLRAVGTPGTLPGLAALGYSDIGPLQHQDSPSNVFVIDD